MSARNGRLFFQSPRCAEPFMKLGQRLFQVIKNWSTEAIVTQTKYGS